MPDFIYDLEIYPNAFTMIVKCATAGDKWRYEISERRNQAADMLALCRYIQSVPGARMVGFNNEGFDYPVLHVLLARGETCTAFELYEKAQAIIECEDRFAHIIWESDRLIEQVDLFKIHHFDNIAKSTSLKALQFAMRAESIEDLPIPPGTYLTDEQIDTLLAYNDHDVEETFRFYQFSLPAIEFREELSRQMGRNYVNFNDTKIGKEYLIAELEKAGVECYDYSTGRREPKQTPRASINLGEIILPTVRFKRPEFQRIRNWLAGQTITETKGVFKDLSVTVDGFAFSFGLGGLHGSINNARVLADDDTAIIDVDVTSFYPSIAITARLYPEHLTPTFCDVYARLKAERVRHKKGTPINAALKLGLNGTFGDSNNPYSVYFDSQFTMSITINGQLLLCMLAEALMDVPRLRLIQANTDGLTVQLPRDQIACMQAVCGDWSERTGLDLEWAHYSMMAIRDVNNYLAETEDGKIKRKGAYCYETPLENPFTGELQWHQDHGARVVAKAAEAYLLDGEPVRRFVETHPQIEDFMLRAKINRTTRLFIGETEQPQRITRYYISRTGEPMVKVMPPVAGKERHDIHVYSTPRGEKRARTASEIKAAEKRGTLLRVERVKAPDRRTDINKGWLTREANRLSTVRRDDINLEWYIAEAEKLIDLKEMK